MGVINTVSVQDLMQTTYKHHQGTFTLVYGIFSNFQVLITLFALAFFGALIFMTVWMRVKASSNYFDKGQPGSNDPKIFAMWMGSSDIFTNGLTMMIIFAVAAITILPIMDQIKSL